MAKRKPEIEVERISSALKVPRREAALATRDETVQKEFFDAVLQSKVEVVQALLNDGAVDVNVTNWSDETALFVAVEKENLEVVQVLLSFGADVNLANKDGLTALFIAASQGSVEIVEVLLSHKIDVNVTDWRGQTALFTAVEEDHLKVVQVLLSHAAVNPNISDEDGQTALFVAVSKVNVEVVEALTSHDGIDVNETDCSGQTALFSASLKGNVEVVQILLRCGINVNITDHLGQTALFIAASKGNVEVVRALLHHGVDDVNLKDDKGNSVLFQMAQLFTDEFSSDLVIQIVKLLVQHKAAVDALNASGESLLFYYLSYARRMKMGRDSVHSLVAVCHFLLESKVDINVRSRSGHSVFHAILMLLQDILGEESPQASKVQATSIIDAAQSLSKLFKSILSSPTFAKTMVSSRDDVHGNTPLHLWASLAYPREHSIMVGGASTADPGSTLESIVSDVGSQLLSQDAQVNAPNSNGETPLHVARKWSAAKMLLDHTALQTATDNFGNTPLLTHVKQNIENHSLHVYDDIKAETVCQEWKEVFGSKLDPWEANDEGETVLSLMLTGDSFDVVKAFLEATGAPYGRKYPVDSNGETPLHVICRDNGEDNFWKLYLIDFLVQSTPHMVNRLNSRRETAVHIACKRKSADPLSVEIIQRLRAYGAKTDLPDDEGKTCFDVAADKPEVVALLKQEIKSSEVEPWLPWSRKSERHKKLLDQVARGQNKLHIDSFHYHTEPIGSGAFGHVYAGLDSKDGREVAVKRVERVRMDRAEDRREIKNLVKLADCKHVVRYLSYSGDQDFLYIVLELMEGTLEELLDTDIIKEEVSLCRDVLDGLSFLHENNIIHRDIKPGNILYKCSPLCLKLADFGLSGKAEKLESAITTTVMHSKAGTRCWMAPELLGKTMEHSKESDVFACGLVLHYLLSGKKHPFEPACKPDESIFVVQHKTEDNILKNKLVVNAYLSAESKHLVKLMLSGDKFRRPSAAIALRHPFFWSNHKKAHLLCVVGNQAELASSHHYPFVSPVVQEIENALGPQFAVNPWDGEFPQLYVEMTQLSRKSRTYGVNSAVDLLRFVRNTYAHLSSLTSDMKTSVLEDYVFLVKFPTLLMTVYKTVVAHKWDQRQDIASAINATQ